MSVQPSSLERTLLLEAGKSFLGRQEEGYVVYSYNLIEPDSVNVGSELLLPARQRCFSRLYADHIANMGAPGDGLVVARRVGDRMQFSIGYVGWDWQPVYIAHTKYGWGEAGSWNSHSMVGLARQELGWLRGWIDERTRRAMGERVKRLRRKEREEFKAAEKRRENARRLNQIKREKAAKRAEFRKFALEVLDNFVAIEAGIKKTLRNRRLIKPELEALEHEWRWL